jgi:hypothetical protein
LGDVQTLGGASEVQFFGKHDEIPEMAQLDHYK